MNWEALGVLMPTLSAVVAVWVALNGEVAKLKGRVRHLEMDRDETKQFMQEVRDALQDIRILLARNEP